MANEGGSGEEAEAELELQLEQQLEEQKASLDAVNEALASDPVNSELLEVHKELVSAIKDAEEGLLHLKRSRLLKQIDAIFPSEEPAPLPQDVKIEPMDLAEVETQDLQAPEFLVGSKCRFRHRDGCWYNGQIIGFKGNHSATVSFLNPTSENMMIIEQKVAALMANEGGSGEEAELELQLEQQLEEQKASLDAVNEALASDPVNSELLEVHKELVSAIKDAEEGLLHLKRSRLLKQIDAIFPSEEPALLPEDVKIEPMDPAEVETQDFQAPEFLVGSKCRFRHRDGCWYNGQIIGFEGNHSATVSFLNPTSENMMMCKFFLQQRCRFGASCRMSHGFIVPISLLRQYIATEWHKSLVGSTILAAVGPAPSIWKRAELESWDEELELGQVVFCEDGASAKLGTESLSLSQYAELSEGDYDDDDGSSNGSGNDNDDEEDEEPSTSGKSQYSDLEEDELGNQGIGFLEATKLQKGVQTETRVFAKWEHHTRGIASKMMASMGYCEGMGLGASGQGRTEPILVKVLPKRQSLDHAVATSENTEFEDSGRKRIRGGKSKGKELGIKRRTRGGRRKREKKFAELARAEKAEEQQGSGVFSLINNQLVTDAKNVSSGSIFKSKKESGDRDGGSKIEENRRSWVAHDDEVKRLKNAINKWEEMASRNQKDKVIYEATMRKLHDVRKELSDAEARYASVCSAVSSKEKEKKWLKF